MPKITIDITGEQAEAIEYLVSTGKYANGSDVVAAALGELNFSHLQNPQDEAALQYLRRMIQEGIDSGPSEPLDFDAFLAELKEEAATLRKTA